MPQVQTLKQAKAAHRKRNNGTLTPAQLREIERQAQLERRAWGVRKREEDRLQAQQKRKEKEDKQRAAERHAIQGSRRLDKTGHVSSQFHLGAFFGVRAASKQFDIPEELAEKATDNETFDCSLNDDDIANACVTEAVGVRLQTESCSVGAVDVGTRETLTKDHVKSRYALDGNCDWDDFLQTGTQIARELNKSESIETPRKQSLTSTSCSTNSFDLSLSSQDFQAINAAIEKVEKERNGENDRKGMPPPAIPAKQKSVRDARSQSSLKTTEDISIKRTMGHNVIPQQTTTLMKEMDITLSQLEAFTDDFSLTQAF